jgi:uncharacterized protein with von Willebrand factor type A (vWA) domain
MTKSITSSGALARNVMSLARLLRSSGLPIGPAKILVAIQAMASIDLVRRDDVYWALHSAFVDRHSQSELFGIVFHQFWIVRIGEQDKPFMFDDVIDEAFIECAESLPRRLAGAMAENGLAKKTNKGRESREQPPSVTWSGSERLRSKDFETMSTEENIMARRAMLDFQLPISRVPTRRFQPHASGRRIDMRSTLRKMIRTGASFDLMRKKAVYRHPPLVVLCDISGSMEPYARMLLHFLHTITNDRDRVHTFLFGTRLTNVTHQLIHSDPDVALRKVSAAVEDWSGGTRIGQSLASFNRKWSRRVLGQGAVVLLITDGLDRDGGAGLTEEIERLQKSCRRLIWLNPLLRFDGFEPKSAGIKAILPYVDDFRSVHNLDSLSEFVEALSSLGGARNRTGTNSAGME